MRILLYSTQYLDTGGTESHIREFCMQMQDLNIDIIILNSNVSHDARNNLAFYCKNIYICKFNSAVLKYSWFLLLILRLNFRKYDALYTNGQGNTLFIIGSFLLNKKKWVHHHHTSGDASDQASWPMLYTKAMLAANKVIACSKWNSEQIAMKLNRNIDVIPVFSKRLLPIPPPNLENKVIKLGYFGRLIREKGIDFICELSNAFLPNEVEFHIWGSGVNYPSSFFNSYPNLVFHGSFSTKEELQEVVNQIDGFLLLTTHPEGLPICLLECMSAGLPWFSTNKGGIRDIVIDAYCTKLIDEIQTFSDLKKETEDFVESIKYGKARSSILIDYYITHFDCKRLKELWTEALLN